MSGSANNTGKQLLHNEWSAMESVAGVRLGVAATNTKYKNRHDVLLIEVGEASEVAGVFTTNAFCAAPVIVAREHLAGAASRYLLTNAGNANAGTGRQGVENTKSCCHAISELTQCQPQQVLPFSTGVVGEHLPVNDVIKVLPEALSSLAEDNWQAAAQAIMTTDTVPKGISREVVIDGHEITVTGIAKGAGMICPNMATMLAYVATNATVAKPLLQATLQKLADKTFNRITVDGDTSTNDACMLIASGASEMPVIENDNDPRFMPLYELLEEVFEFLARAIIRDAEGATKLVNVTVQQGYDEAECTMAAYTIAHSPLVKTALFASDPNWGRILAAIGRAGIKELDINKIKITLNGVCIVSGGARDSEYTEDKGQQAMSKEEINIDIYLGRGDASANVWTCDLSYDYVKINAEYRT